MEGQQGPRRIQRPSVSPCQAFTLQRCQIEQQVLRNPRSAPLDEQGRFAEQIGDQFVVLRGFCTAGNARQGRSQIPDLLRPIQSSISFE